jgi:hypothetical protein
MGWFQQRGPSAVWAALGVAQDGSKMWAGAKGGLVYRSKDNGQTWAAAGPDATARQYATVACDQDCAIVVVGVTGGALYTTANGDAGTVAGITWTARGANANWAKVKLSLDQAGFPRFVALMTGSAQITYGNPQVATSWATAGTSLAYSALSCDNTCTNVVVTEANGRPWRSTNSGAAWRGTPVATVAPGDRTSGIARAWTGVASNGDGSQFIAVAYNDAVYRSYQGGLSTNCQILSNAQTNAYNNMADYARATLPSPGYGRYVYLANGHDQCLSFYEMQVWAANSCPQRTGLSAPGAQASSPFSDATGGASCGDSSPFGTRCNLACVAPDVLISGTASTVCNGETWTNGVAATAVCGPTCPDVAAPANAGALYHEVYNENFVGVTGGVRLARLASLNPFTNPLASTWALIDGAAQALGRLGAQSEPALIFVVDKVRRMDATMAFTVAATFSTADRAGVLFRVADEQNYYRAVLDVRGGLHAIEAVVAGVPRTVADAALALPANVPVTLSVAVSGYDFFMSVNGRLLLQGSDRALQQGYSGIFSQSTATFTATSLTRAVTSCVGATEGERCTVVCQPGLASTGPLTRTCVAGVWNTSLSTATVCIPPSPPPAVSSTAQLIATYSNNRLTAPASTPAVTGATTIATDYATGSAIFVGGKDSSGTVSGRAHGGLVKMPPLLPHHSRSPPRPTRSP